MPPATSSTAVPDDIDLDQFAALDDADRRDGQGASSLDAANDPVADEGGTAAKRPRTRKKKVAAKAGRSQAGDTARARASSAALRKLCGEAAMIVFGAAALLLAIALLTYNPADAGWSSVAAQASAPVTNVAGSAGAWWADVAYTLLGRMALLLPLLLAVAGWRLARAFFARASAPADALAATPSAAPKASAATEKAALLALFGGGADGGSARRALAGLDGYAWAGWTGGFLVLLFAGCALLALHTPAGDLPAGAGGVAGELLAGQLGPMLGVAGATLSLVAVLALGVSLFTGLSWLTIIDRLGGATLALAALVQVAVGRLRDLHTGIRSRREREQKVEVVLQQRATKPPAPPVVVEAPKAAAKKMLQISTRALRAKQQPLFEAPDLPTAPGELPSLALLEDPSGESIQMSEQALETLSRQVELKMADFGIEVSVVAVLQGPVVTRFELEPAPGLKVSKVTALSRDLARSLSKISVRVVEVIAGKTVIGLELPNDEREMVYLSEILRSKTYDDQNSKLTLALGKDVAGEPMVLDLGRMPHLLVAGTTGSGKSVAINAMILSLLFKAQAEDVRLIMIDPKMLELSVYEGIPHLLAPVVTDMKLASNALRWCVGEMERRYQLMSAVGVRNLAGFNKKVLDAHERGEPIIDPTWVAPDVPPWEEGSSSPLGASIDPPVLEKMPFIVVIVDELADLMMTTGKKCEELIARLAQKARAAGIHLILATQRPSVDVITGLIKANIPSRIAFQVSSKVDSRTILDQMGAESLLGHGDMLYLTPGVNAPVRVHGAFVSDADVHAVVAALKASGQPNYIDAIVQGEAAGIDPNSASAALLEETAESDGESDPLYDEAVKVVTESRRGSISYVQRRLKVGYNRAATMLEQMEASGVVGPLASNGSRDVLAPPPISD